MPRILVADDNTNIQKMVVLAFQERGIEVVAVGNGEAAVRRIPDSNPDLVLADVFMPVRNGYEVCEFVKKDARFSHIPVILLVGAFDPLDEKEARRVGADGVLKKPFVPPDPLIAMVMSALEKNPKVIAELAKAKEAKEAAAALTALPTAAMESPAKAEIKPLPEFPEPSPEEAAMIYGFGKGVRAIDAEEGEEDEPETKKSKSSSTLKDPQADKKSKTPAAAAPKTPVVQMEEEEDEEIFDGSATASDWRRNAADFEVPENIEANPIYSYGKNFEPITFPSERDVPPKRVRAEEDDQAAAHAPSAEAAPASPSPDASAVSDPSASWELTTDDELEAQHVEGPKAEAAAPVAAAQVEVTPAEETPSAVVPRSQVEAASVQTPEPVVQAAAETETAVVAAENKATAATEPESKESSRPSFVARVRGWMDMMSPSSDESNETKSDEREQHWMTSLAAPAVSNESLEVESTAISAPLNATEIGNPVQLAEAESLAETAPAPAIAESSAVEEIVAPTAGLGAEQVQAEPVQEERFETAPMADLDQSLSRPGPMGGSDAPIYEPEPVSAPEAFNEPEPVAKEEVAPPEPVHQQIDEQVHEPVHAAAEESAPFIPAEEPNQFEVAAQTRWTDSLPTLGEAPQNGSGPSEHLPLEPMIGHLHEQPFASASEPEQEPAQVAEWLRHRAHQAEQEPQPVESAASESAAHVWAQEHREPDYDEKPFADQPESSIFEPEPVQAAVQEFAERIPTMPPPNREALSQIPFLMPNVEREPGTSDGTNAANSAAVDEVVRRVLEKLQPQLHELLSQGVKPLVENMLQHELNTELHKNEK